MVMTKALTLRAIVVLLILSHGTDDTYSAAASIATWVSRALIDLGLTACTSVSGQTRTSVAPLASVGAGGSILTGLMVRAVV